MKKFIEQQETMVPPNRRRREMVYTVKVPKRRGRKRSIIDARRFLFYRRLALAVNDPRPMTREQFAAALGIDPRTVNTMSAAFIRTPPEEHLQQRLRQRDDDERFCTPERLTGVPLLETEDIYRRDFIPKGDPEELDAVTFPKDEQLGSRLHYFAFTMEDDCMVMDGICAGDRIVAVRNVRPCRGDMVVCRIPGLKVITVRRYADTSNPSFFDLYEGGTTNPLFACEYENLIYGVVVAVERIYRPGRLPQPWEKIAPEEPLPEKPRTRRRRKSAAKPAKTPETPGAEEAEGASLS